MKKILLGLLIISCTCTSGYCAQGYVFTANDAIKPATYSQSLQISSMPYGQYLKYYNFSPAKINAEFIRLSKEEENKFLKTLTKEEKENYKYVKKIQNLISKGDWKKVFEKYPNYFPAYLQYYNVCYQNAKYNEALRILTNIKTMDKTAKVYSPEFINHTFGVLYFLTGQYTYALNYFKMYEHSGDDFVISSIANCYYSLGNYSAAIEYCKKLKNPQYQDTELLYGSYFQMKNYTEANKYALELLKQDYNYKNLMRVQATTSDEAQKLSYAYKARGLAQNDDQIIDTNEVIAVLEQKKLDNSVSKLTNFVKVPNWAEFEEQIPENIPETEVSAKQDEFFKTANLYLKKYTGTQLTNAFNSLNQDYNNYVQQKRNQYYQEKQLEAQKALVLEQQRNNILQQQIIREQQIRNYLERQNLYYRSYPYYYRHRPYYIW